MVMKFYNCLYLYSFEDMIRKSIKNILGFSLT